MILTNDMDGWEKLLSGQAGFILATMLFGLFFWKVLLPRWDKQVDAISRLANAVKAISITLMNQTHSTGEKISEALEEIETGNRK
jgi:hypothetical protein